MPLPFTDPPKSLCILRLSAIGDVCHSVAVVRAIQDQWPKTQLTWIVGALEATLVGDIPGIEFITFDKKKGRAAFHALKAQLSNRQFDALLHMQVSLRASMASRYVHAPVRLGFDRSRAKDFQWLFTNQKISKADNQHVLDALFGFAQAIGVAVPAQPRWDIPIPADAARYAEQHLPGTQPTLVISPCSSTRFRNFRNWSAERYAAVVNHAIERHGMRVVLTGGPTELEQEYGARISAMAQHPVVNLIGQSNLKQLLAILQRAAVLVSPDSGPAHMATAVGCPVIGLYATSNPFRTGPYLSQQWVVNKYPEAVRQQFGKDVTQVAWGQRVRRADVMDLIAVGDVCRMLDSLRAAARR